MAFALILGSYPVVLIDFYAIPGGTSHGLVNGTIVCAVSRWFLFVTDIAIEDNIDSQTILQSSIGLIGHAHKIARTL